MKEKRSPNVVHKTISWMKCDQNIVIWFTTYKNTVLDLFVALTNS